jgi:hypothetical protein
MADLTDALNELLGARTSQISRRIDADPPPLSRRPSPHSSPR